MKKMVLTARFEIELDDLGWLNVALVQLAPRLASLTQASKEGTGLQPIRIGALHSVSIGQVEEAGGRPDLVTMTVPRHSST